MTAINAGKGLDKGETLQSLCQLRSTAKLHLIPVEGVHVLELRSQELVHEVFPSMWE